MRRGLTRVTANSLHRAPHRPVSLLPLSTRKRLRSTPTDFEELSFASRRSTSYFEDRRFRADLDDLIHRFSEMSFDRVDFDNLVRRMSRLSLKGIEPQSQSELFPPLPGSVRENPALNAKVDLEHGDITRLSNKVEVIVNAANRQLQSGTGVCGSIFASAGPRQLQEACEKELSNRGKERLDLGDAVLTPGFGLGCSVIHVVGPRHSDNKPMALRNAYWNVLEICRNQGLRSVAFPCISTGVFGFPRKQAAIIAVAAVRQWFEHSPENAGSMDSVIFCTFIAQERRYYKKLIQTFFPRSQSVSMTQNASGTGSFARGSVKNHLETPRALGFPNDSSSADSKDSPPFPRSDAISPSLEQTETKSPAPSSTHSFFRNSPARLQCPNSLRSALSETPRALGFPNRFSSADPKDSPAAPRSDAMSPSLQRNETKSLAHSSVSGFSSNSAVGSDSSARSRVLIRRPELNDDVCFRAFGSTRVGTVVSIGQDRCTVMSSWNRREEVLFSRLMPKYRGGNTQFFDEFVWNDAQLVRVPIRRDGNCLFRALALALEHRCLDHAKYRKIAFEWLVCFFRSQF